MASAAARRTAWALSVNTSNFAAITTSCTRRSLSSLDRARTARTYSRSRRVGRALSRLQTGNVQLYATGLVVGSILVAFAVVVAQ